ncbi:MAG: hypothetical protein KGM18_00015 [Sphingomonadales bacterium]|nr:hypothetical protein [Sphingomonadales bacterium]
MPPTQKLKVFRVPIGFHDAYVAVPSQKAALAAWGADADLFARGIAERVDDPELMREPLARPGTVVRRLRGTVQEQIASLPPDPPRSRRIEERPERGRRAVQPKAKRAPPAPLPPPPPKPPRPPRDAIVAAEEAEARLRDRHAEARRELEARSAALESELRALRAQQDNERAAARREVEQARADFARALAGWRK